VTTDVAQRRWLHGVRGGECADRMKGGSEERRG